MAATRAPSPFTTPPASVRCVRGERDEREYGVANRQSRRVDGTGRSGAARRYSLATSAAPAPPTRFRRAPRRSLCRLRRLRVERGRRSRTCPNSGFVRVKETIEPFIRPFHDSNVWVSSKNNSQSYRLRFQNSPSIRNFFSRITLSRVPFFLNRMRPYPSPLNF